MLKRLHESLTSQSNVICSLQPESTNKNKTFSAPQSNDLIVMGLKEKYPSRVTISFTSIWLCRSELNASHHKVLTYVEYRAVSGVFQNIDPPPPSPPSEYVLPRTKGRGVHTRRAVRGWRVNILEDARHWIGLLQYNLSTPRTNNNRYNTNKFLQEKREGGRGWWYL